MTPSYVVAWRLAGRRVLVVGGGRTAEAKVEHLRGLDAHLTVVAPTLTNRLTDLHRGGAFRWRARCYRPTDLLRVSLVVAATDDHALNGRIARLARPLRVLVNAVDDPRRCDVTVPAVIRRGPVTIAVTTEGISPAAARFLRDHVARTVPTGVAALVAEAGRLRQELRRHGDYRYDYTAWEERFLRPGLEAVTAGRSGALDELGRRFLATFNAAPGPIASGRLSVVGAGRGGPELLTVRGAELVASADVVFYEGAVGRRIVDLAPVVAARIPIDGALDGDVSPVGIDGTPVARARSGAHVVWLRAGDGIGSGPAVADAVRAATAAGIGVEVVPGVSVGRRTEGTEDPAERDRRPGRPVRRSRTGG